MNVIENFLIKQSEASLSLMYAYLKCNGTKPLFPISIFLPFIGFLFRWLQILVVFEFGIIRYGQLNETCSWLASARFGSLKQLILRFSL